MTLEEVLNGPIITNEEAGIVGYATESIESAFVKDYV